MRDPSTPRCSRAPLLGRLTDARGRTAAAWATAPLAGAEYAPELVPDGRAVALLSRDGRVRAEPSALPVWTNALDGLCLTAVLAGTADVDGLFAEVRRVLQPAGTLVVVTPSAAVRTPGQLRLRAVHRRGWPHRSALDDVGWLLAAADFAVLAEDRVAFSVEVPGTAPHGLAADLSAAGLWPPRVPADIVARLGSESGRRWPVPLRRLIARR
jgi:SAM-dependent methyltransferase